MCTYIEQRQSTFFFFVFFFFCLSHTKYGLKDNTLSNIRPEHTVNRFLLFASDLGEKSVTFSN